MKKRIDRIIDTNTKTPNTASEILRSYAIQQELTIGFMEKCSKEYNFEMVSYYRHQLMAINSFIYASNLISEKLSNAIVTKAYKEDYKALRYIFNNIYEASVKARD